MTQTAKSFASGKSGAEDNFSSSLTFLITTVGSAVGFGNVWRFPYLVYEYGGLVFILTYLVVLFVITYPLMMLEMGLGQLLRGGQVQAWAKMGKNVRSPGLTTWTSFTVCLFYPMLLAWSLIFFANSFTKTFGWANNPEWQSTCHGLDTKLMCVQQPFCEWRECVEGKKCIWDKPFCAVDSLYSSTEFLRNQVYVMQDFTGRDKDFKLTSISGNPVLALFITWTLNVVCVFAGAKILGYSTYLTMSLPAIFLIILVGISSSLDGATDGIIDYIGNFKVEKFTATMLVEAVCQSIFSASLGQGVVTALAAHNDRHDNFARNALIVLLADTFFAFIAGFAVFAMVGFLAKESSLPISELPLKGISLAFTAYPAAMAQITGVLANICSALFFLTLWLVGFSTIVTLTEALVLTTVVSRIGKFFKLKRWHATVLYSLFFFLIPGLLLSTNLGLAMLDSIDNYNSVGQAYGAGLQAVCVGWLYLSKYTVAKIGRTAYWVHGVTFFLGPFLMGALSTTNAIVGLVLGLLIPILGFLLALYLCNRTDADGNELSYVDKMYYLSIYNVAPLRKAFNDMACSSSRLRVPYAWSYIIKYLVPFVTMYLTISVFSDSGRMYKYPGGESYSYPWFLIMIGQFSPFLMIFCTILILVYPVLITPCLPEGDYENRKAFGERLITVFDRHKPKGQLTSSHLLEEEIEIETK